MYQSIADLQGKRSHRSSFLLSLMACTQNFILQPLSRLFAGTEADLGSRVSVFVQAVSTDKLGGDLRDHS